ncbi:MAG: 30S ribosome-binding factor RbfA [Clostridia bacterium]|nr:30S ribosome-binding factor RbfA [Clostridia bacterium]
MAGYKQDRVAEDIKRAIISVICELKDPRVAGKMLTVVRVDVSGDLSYAKVYVSALEGLDTAKQAVKALKNAEGYVKNHVSKALHLRKTPELHFVADNSIEIGMKIDQILKDNQPTD